MFAAQLKHSLYNGLQHIASDTQQSCLLRFYTRAAAQTNSSNSRTMLRLAASALVVLAASTSALTCDTSKAHIDCHQQGLTEIPDFNYVHAVSL